MVRQNGNEIAKTKTDNRGRFYLSNLPADSKGSTYLIEIPDVGYSQEETVFAGQVKDLSNIEVKAAAKEAQPVTNVTGTLLGPDSNPLVNATVRDKEFTFRSTQTNANGEFTLETVSEQVEVIINDNTPPIGVTVDEINRNSLVTIDVSDIRTIRGVIKDSTNSNVSLANVAVKIAGRSTSSFTDENGNYEINGAPLGPLTLEVTPEKGYGKTNVQIPPATFIVNEANERRSEDVIRNIGLRPIGNIQVSFTAESSLGLGEYGSCDLNYNCIAYDLDGQPGPENYYDNKLGVLNELTATISVEGTDITQTVTYPPATIADLKGIDRFGEALTISEAHTLQNHVLSVLLEDVPGGKQNITISMTGRQTQKSIAIFVPP